MTDSFYKISPFIESQVPEFIRIGNSDLVTFLDAYFEWLENEYSVISPRKLKTSKDVNESIDIFTNQFFNQYLKGFPQNLVYDSNGLQVNKSTLVKNIKDFYKAKGTKKTYDLLFRILFNTDVDVYLPKTDILVASGGKYIQQKSIRITNNLGDDIFLVKGQKIRQIDATTNEIKAYARCERVVTFREGKFEVAELFLSDIKGTFEASYPIVFEVNNKKYVETYTYSVITSFNISSQGRGHVVGEKVVITDTNGSGAVAEVSRIGSLGEIKKIRMINFGANYKSSGTISVIFERTDDEIEAAENQILQNYIDINGEALGTFLFESLSETQLQTLVTNLFNSNSAPYYASATVNIGGLCNYEGYYADESGQLSTTKVLQDNKFYQTFSYVLKSEVTISRYKDAVKRLVHPSGFAFFGSVMIKRCAEENIFTSVNLIQYELSVIGNYTPYTFNTTDSLNDDYPNGYYSDTLGATIATPGNENGDPYWIIFAHPNTDSRTGITSGVAFKQIEINRFVKIPTGYSFVCSGSNIETNGVI